MDDLKQSISIIGMPPLDSGMSLFDVAEYYYDAAESMSSASMAAGFLELSAKCALRYVYRDIDPSHKLQYFVDKLPDRNPYKKDLAKIQRVIESWIDGTIRPSESELKRALEVVRGLLDFIHKLQNPVKESDSWLLEYLDASEIDDFYASIPSSMVVDKDNVEMLVSMYRSLK